MIFNYNTHSYCFVLFQAVGPEILTGCRPLFAAIQPVAGSLGVSHPLPEDMQHLPPSFVKLLDSEPLVVQQQMLTALMDNIAILERANLPAPGPNKNSAPNVSKPVSRSKPDPKDELAQFVEHVENPGIDRTLAEAIRSELQSLNFSTDKPQKVKTIWLSPSSESYNYSSIINKPLPINDFPNICNLLSIVNSHPSSTSDADACLVSLFPSREAGLALHKDDEDLISQNSSICTVSFGDPRRLEFVRDGKILRKRKDLTPDLTLPATDCSMNVMKPGAQAIMKHRVPKGELNTDGPCSIRFSLSFRKLTTSTTTTKDTTCNTHANHDVLNASSQSTHDSSPPPTAAKKHVILVAGDSFPARLDSARLSKGKKTVINIAVGGSKISKVMKSIEEYVDKNPSVKVVKLFVSIGTNDIRNCKNGIDHLKNVIGDFMKFLKTKLPSTTVYFQSLPPIHANGCPYTVKNVVAMNNLIYRLCSRFKLYYVDVLSIFLNESGYRDSRLFPEFDKIKNEFNIHPNKRGMGVLAKVYIYFIHSRWFNPMGY